MDPYQEKLEMLDPGLDVEAMPRVSLEDEGSPQRQPVQLRCSHCE